MNAAPFGHGIRSSVNHMPEKSGFPSAMRGVGAPRFGFPLGSLGTPAVGYLSHWADVGTEPQIAVTRIARPRDRTTCIKKTPESEHSTMRLSRPTRHSRFAIHDPRLSVGSR